jgi:hypothetical protein
MNRYRVMPLSQQTAGELFTYDPFARAGTMPCPGPVFVHKAACRRYEDAGFPAALIGLPLTVEGYDDRGLPLLRRSVAGDPDVTVEEVLAWPEVAFAHVRHTKAGCFIARIEQVRIATRETRSGIRPSLQATSEHHVQLRGLRRLAAARLVGRIPLFGSALDGLAGRVVT